MSIISSIESIVYRDRFYPQHKMRNFNIKSFPVDEAPQAYDDIMAARTTLEHHARANGVNVTISKSEDKPDCFVFSVESVLNNRNRVSRTVNPNLSEDKQAYYTYVNQDGRTSVVRDDVFLRHVYRVFDEAIKSMHL